MTTEQAERIRANCEIAPSNFPGPFTERACAFYFYEAMLDGSGEELGEFDGCAVVAFDIDADDIAIFPDLAGEDRVYFYEREDGFWCEIDAPTGEADESEDM